MNSCCTKISFSEKLFMRNLEEIWKSGCNSFNWKDTELLLQVDEGINRKQQIYEFLCICGSLKKVDFKFSSQKSTFFKCYELSMRHLINLDPLYSNLWSESARITKLVKLKVNSRQMKEVISSKENQQV
jgi:hypothetical protein